jgi:hypothetical protein
VPAYGYHRYVGDSASMVVKLFGLVPVARVSGPHMTRAETVTMFNDMCLLAPATLIDPAIQWDARDDSTVRGRYTHAGHTIAAELSFNDAGELVDFWSDDRGQLSADGTSIRQARWSTPAGQYRDFGAFRLTGSGAARWTGGGQSFAYIEIAIDDVVYNGAR